MICQHQSIKQKIVGQRADCILCHLEVIFDGSRWGWLYSIDKDKRRKYELLLAREMGRSTT